jgi:hypothetical protein
MAQGTPLSTLISPEEFRAMWADGSSVTDYAKRLGVYSDTVTRYALKLGLEARGTTQGAREERDARMRTVHATGAQNAEIARQVGCDPMTVTKTLKRLGLEGNRREPKPKPEPKPKSSDRSAARGGGRTRASAIELERASHVPITQRCTRCPWTMDGAMGETRAAFAAHECVPQSVAA